jgi:hypothetical protein
MMMNLGGKRKLKKSALGCYKRNLRTVSDQTMRNRAVCKTQAENVSKKCFTKAAGGRTNERTKRHPSGTAQRCSRTQESCLVGLYLFFGVSSADQMCKTI